MAEDITLDEKVRRFESALDKLHQTVEAGAGVPDEIFNDFVVAAENYRSDTQFRALLGPAGCDSDRIL